LCGKNAASVLLAMIPQGIAAAPLRLAFADRTLVELRSFLTKASLRSNAHLLTAQHTCFGSRFPQFEPVNRVDAAQQVFARYSLRRCSLAQMNLVCEVCVHRGCTCAATSVSSTAGMILPGINEVLSIVLLQVAGAHS
jgi:hypothetical protein